MTPATPAVPVFSVACSIQKGPDGTSWPCIHINLGTSSYAVALPLDAAETLAEGFGPMLRDTITDTKIANGGIVVANHLPKGNPA